MKINKDTAIFLLLKDNNGVVTEEILSLFYDCVSNGFTLEDLTKLFAESTVNDLKSRIRPESKPVLLDHEKTVDITYKAGEYTFDITIQTDHDLRDPYTRNLMSAEIGDSIIKDIESFGEIISFGE